MNTQTKIAGALAGAGVLALVLLEHSLAPDPNLYVLGAISFAGLGRLYLFVQGQTMEDDKDRKIALRISIAISLAFVVYVFLIYFVAQFHTYLLFLFMLTTATLIALEWTLGKKVGYSIKDKKAIRISSKQRAIDVIGYLRKQIATLNIRVLRLEELYSESDENQERLSARLIELESIVTIGQMALDHWLLIDNKKHKVCPNCNSLQKLPSNAAGQLVCLNELESGGTCNTLIWTKKKELV